MKPVRERRCIVMFVKCPGRGEIKSRLRTVLDDESIALLYEAFVLDLLDTLRQGGHPYRIAFTPEDSGDEIGRRFGRCDLMPQRGADLGERMGNAFERSFADGFTQVLIIGSDLPDLTPEILAEACSVLDSRDAVVGPALDGGYYLIGFTKKAYVPGVFTGIPWGTEAVFPETMARLERAGSAVHLLPYWRDVDRPDDLQDLIRRNRTTPFARSRTMRCLAAGGSFRQLDTTQGFHYKLSSS